MNCTRLLFTFSLLVIVNTTFAKELVVGLSPFQPTVVQKSFVQTLVEYLCHQKDYEQVHFIDAYRLTTIGSFIVPEGSAYQSAKARLRVNGKSVTSLLDFSKGAIEDLSEAPKTVGAIRPPQFFELVSRQFPNAKNILILGSLVYDVPSDPAFSMVGSVYPSDAHILASREETVFGTKDVSFSQHGSVVYWVNTDSSTRYSSQYQYLINRFWMQYISSLGAQVSIVSDLQGVITQLGLSVAPSTETKLDASSRLEMIRLRERYIPQVLTGPKPIHHDKSSKNINIHKARGVEVSLSWDCEVCDLDLYVLLDNGEVLYFSNTTSEVASFYKEIRSLTEPNKGYETVVFQREIDLSKVSAVANFYSGVSVGGVHGEFVLSLEGANYHYPFHIDVERGNGKSGPELILDASKKKQSHAFGLDSLGALVSKLESERE